MPTYHPVCESGEDQDGYGLHGDHVAEQLGQEIHRCPVKPRHVLMAEMR